MAVRVRIRITAGSGKQVDTVAVLNGGFEMDEPHLLLPRQCASRLFGADTHAEAEQVLQTAGGVATLNVRADRVRACIVTPERVGPHASFRVLVSNEEDEALVSDAGIDALGVQIESFKPARWRFRGEELVREDEAPQIW